MGQFQKIFLLFLILFFSVNFTLARKNIGCGDIEINGWIYPFGNCGEVEQKRKAKKGTREQGVNIEKQSDQEDTYQGQSWSVSPSITNLRPPVRQPQLTNTSPQIPQRPVQIGPQLPAQSNPGNNLNYPPRSLNPITTPPGFFNDSALNKIFGDKNNFTSPSSEGVTWPARTASLNTGTKSGVATDAKSLPELEQKRELAASQAPTLEVIAKASPEPSGIVGLQQLTSASAIIPDGQKGTVEGDAKPYSVIPIEDVQELPEPVAPIKGMMFPDDPRSLDYSEWGPGFKSEEPKVPSPSIWERLSDLISGSSGRREEINSEVKYETIPDPQDLSDSSAGVTSQQHNERLDRMTTLTDKLGNEGLAAKYYGNPRVEELSKVAKGFQGKEVGDICGGNVSCYEREMGRAFEDYLSRPSFDKLRGRQIDDKSGVPHPEANQGFWERGKKEVEGFLNDFFKKKPEKENPIFMQEEKVPEKTGKELLAEWRAAKKLKQEKEQADKKEEERVARLSKFEGEREEGLYKGLSEDQGKKKEDTTKEKDYPHGEVESIKSIQVCKDKKEVDIKKCAKVDMLLVKICPPEKNKSGAKNCVEYIDDPGSKKKNGSTPEEGKKYIADGPAIKSNLQGHIYVVKGENQPRKLNEDITNIPGGKSETVSANPSKKI